MRSAVPAVSAIAFVLVSFGLFMAGRPAVHERDSADPAAAEVADAEPEFVGAETIEPRRPAAGAEEPPDISPARSRLIAPGVVAPPQLDPDELQREAPREPLSPLSLPLPPKSDSPAGGLLFRPRAVGSAVVESMGRKVSIAGALGLAPGETCEFEGEPWACGMRARTAFRMWLRGRALDCDLPPDAGDEVTASCRLGKQDAGAWLVSNGWARAAPSGPYAQAEAEAREAGRGIFGPPPAALPVDAGAADHIEAATLPADPTVPVE